MVKVFKSENGQKKVFKSYDLLLQQWDVDFKEVDVETKYGVTHCIVSGNKSNPPLLMFHGVGDNSAVMWLLNIKELSSYFYCVSVDVLGGPGKSVPSENFTKDYFDQVRWIDELIQIFDLGNINILGVSNGAYIAYNYASNSAEIVNKVVCLEGGMVIENPLISVLKTLLIMFPQIMIPSNKNLTTIMKKMISPDSMFFELYPEVVEHLILLMKNHNRKAMFVHNLEKYNEEEGKAIKDKIYFLFGDFRIEQKYKYIEFLKDKKFKYKIIEGAGHGINHEQPEKVNKEIINFIYRGGKINE